MEEFMLFIDFLTWMFQVTSFLFGVLVGLLAAACTAGGWRVYRRRVLRSNWRKDRPMRAYDGVEPQWRDYDPEIPEISGKCICHNRRLYEGERVLVWPEVGPGGLLHVAVYCETYEDLTKRGDRAEDAEPADGRRA